MYLQFCNEAKSCVYWLVNETLRYETETRPRHLIFSPRRDRDLPTFPRDRDVWKLRLETVSRPRRRDRDYIPAKWYPDASSRLATIDIGRKVGVDELRPHLTQCVVGRGLPPYRMGHLDP